MLGTLTGSISARAKQLVDIQIRTNPVARTGRYNAYVRVLRGFFSQDGFWAFLFIYIVTDTFCIFAEALISVLSPSFLNSWTLPETTPAIDELLILAAGYLIGGQIAILGVVSIAIGLVAVIYDKDTASVDVRAYYHESIAFELVASSVALIAVLCVELGWPLQFLLHALGYGVHHRLFKLVLLAIHILWLTINLLALAHFIQTTLTFFQASDRRIHRERYTANYVFPTELLERLRQSLYSNAARNLNLNTTHQPEADDLGSVIFGFDLGEEDVELSSIFGKRAALVDVRLHLVGWVVRRWLRRCDKAAANPPNRQRRERPLLIFSSEIDIPHSGRVDWCKRRHGVPLTNFERWVLRRAFVFRTMRDGT